MKERIKIGFVKFFRRLTTGSKNRNLIREREREKWNKNKNKWQCFLFIVHRYVSRSTHGTHTHTQKIARNVCKSRAALQQHLSGPLI